MNSLEKIVKPVAKNCYMTSTSLKNAYFTISIALQDRKYLRIFWQGTSYQLCCLLFGLSPVARIFAKVIKLQLTVLREMGHESAIH